MSLHPLHVIDPRAQLVRRGGRIEVRCDGKLVASVPLTHLSSVVLEGYAGMTGAVMRSLLGAGIPVALTTCTGRVLGRLDPPGSPSVDLRQCQLRRSLDPGFCLDVGRAIIVGKIRNQRTLISGRVRRSVNSSNSAAPRALDSLMQLARRAEAAPTLSILLGLEGAAAGLYFGVIRHLVGPDTTFARRGRREPDVFNALVNYCSALLRETVINSISAAGLDPYVSFLHTASRGRPTLAFDLMEEWRPLLVEGTTLALLGLRAVGAEDLARTDEGPRLSEAARRAAVHRFFQRLAAPNASAGGYSPGGLRAKLDHQVGQFAAVVSGRSNGPYHAYRWR